MKKRGNAGWIRLRWYFIEGNENAPGFEKEL